MMSKSTLIAGGILAAGLLTAALPAGAQSADGAPPAAAMPEAGGPHPWGGHHPMGPAHLFRQVGLTDTQKQSMKTLLSAAKPELESLHGQVRANLKRLHDITPDDPTYAAVLAAVSQANGNLHTQIAAQEGNLYAQMYALLTPAQKTQLAALQARQGAGPERAHWRHGPPDADVPTAVN